jgi:hypothetical protein
MKRPRANVAGRAVRAALAMPARVGWITGANFDDPKRARLTAMLDGIAEPEKAIALIRETESAVIELAMDDNRRSKKAQGALAEVAAAARALVKAWADVRTGTGYIPLRDAMRAGVPAADIIARRERVALVERVMGEDLLYLAVTAERIVAAVRAGGKVRRPAEYLCATRIALAWNEATGTAATLTRNVEAVSGPQATAFQRFVAQAAPHIGETTWRQVAEALGSKSRKTAAN